MDLAQKLVACNVSAHAGDLSGELSLLLLLLLQKAFHVL